MTSTSTADSEQKRDRPLHRLPVHDVSVYLDVVALRSNDSDQPLVLVDRDIFQVHDPEYANRSESLYAAPAARFPVLGCIGVVTLYTGPYLLLATDATHVETLNGHPIYKLTGIKALQVFRCLCFGDV